MRNPNKGVAQKKRVEFLSRTGRMIVRRKPLRRSSLNEAIAYVLKGYHRLWRMESVGCHWTRMTTPDAVISSYSGPEGTAYRYVAVCRRERLGVTETFVEAVALIDAAYSLSGEASL